MRKISVCLLFVFVIINCNLSAQTFGFGCLGFVGGYGGYSYQKYQPGALNDYIDNINYTYEDSLSSRLDKFGKADGYRLGLNFFRAKYKGFIITAKGFYQNLSEEHNATEYLSGGNGSTTLELNMN